MRKLRKQKGSGKNRVGDIKILYLEEVEEFLVHSQEIMSLN